MSSDGKRRGFWVFVGILAILHQDFWYWDDTSVVFGFMPIGLAYHAGFSITAALTWAYAVKNVWPSHLEEWANAGDETETPGGER